MGRNFLLRCTSMGRDLHPGRRSLSTYLVILKKMRLGVYIIPLVSIILIGRRAADYLSHSGDSLQPTKNIIQTRRPFSSYRGALRRTPPFGQHEPAGDSEEKCSYFSDGCSRVLVAADASTRARIQ